MVSFMTSPSKFGVPSFLRADLTIVAIDDASLAQLGRWPWPRAKIAVLIHRLAEAGAKVIAVDIVFLPSQGEGSGQDDPMFGEAARRAGNVILPFYFTLGKSKEGMKKAAMAPPVAAASFLLFDDPKKFFDFPLPLLPRFLLPMPKGLKGARALGHINVLPDTDGTVRWDPLIIEYAGYYFPSFSLQIAALPRGAFAGGHHRSRRPFRPFGEEKNSDQPPGMMLLNYYGGYQTFPYHSSVDVLFGKNALPRTLRGKLFS